MNTLIDDGKTGDANRAFPNCHSLWHAIGFLSASLLLSATCHQASGAEELSVGIRMVPEISVTGIPNTPYLLQAVDQLGNTNDWTTVASFVMTNSSFSYYEAAAGSTKRFYRAVSLGDQPVSTNNMVWIKPGSFMMGLSDSDTENFDVEKPASKVTISNGFWMSKYEVTQEEYISVTGENPSAFKDAANMPVDSVSWMNASTYCAKLTEAARMAKTLPAGYVYRLPTEAEWEYAARAGSINRFSFGTDASYTTVLQYGWVDANSEGSTHPVGLKLPNAWGLYDMVGNVSEWCSDWYAFNAYTADDKSDPTGPATGTDKVYRGGSWSDAAVYSRSSSRNSMDPQFGLNSFGFRVVLGKP